MTPNALPCLLAMNVTQKSLTNAQKFARHLYMLRANGTDL